MNVFGDSEERNSAAWLLLVLIPVAVLLLPFVIIFIAFAEYHVFGTSLTEKFFRRMPAIHEFIGWLIESMGLK